MVSQVGESLATLGSSSAKHEKLAETQQSQMAELMIQTRKVIQQRHDTSQGAKQQQWDLNSQFVGLNQRRKDVEEEFQREKGYRKVLSGRVNLSNIEEKGDMSQLEQELSETMESNRHRTEPVHGFAHGSTTQVLGGAKIESRAPYNAENGNLPCESPQQAYDFEQHAPAREARAPTFGNLNGSRNSTTPPGIPTTSTYFGQMPVSGQANRNSTHWLLRNVMIEVRPAFGANLFQTWRLEVKFRRQDQVGANPTHPISKIASHLPMNSRMEALSYLEGA